MTGKGSKQRPTNAEAYGSQFDVIFRKKTMSEQAEIDRLNEVIEALRNQQAFTKHSYTEGYEKARADLGAQPDHSELVKRLRDRAEYLRDCDWLFDAEIMDAGADALEGKAIGETK